MNPLRTVVVGLLLFPIIVQANGWVDGIELGMGRSYDDKSAFRVSLQKNFARQWLNTNTGYLTGYFDLSFNRWKTSNSINTYAFSPVITYVFHELIFNGNVFVEGGVGASYVSEWSINDLDLGGNFQFENRLGIGIKYQLWRVSSRFFHYSNADIHDSNDGVDLWLLSLQYLF